jgi:peroxiredoxin
MRLGRYHLWQLGDPERARPHHERILELTTDAVEVLWARGALYEIECLQPGQSAPDVFGTAIDGREVRLSDFRGRVVCLDFWAASCGPCWRVMPHLRAIRKEHADDVLVLIGVSKDSNLEQCTEVIDQEGLNWPHIWEPYPPLQDPLKSVEDCPDEDSIARRYNVWAIPRAYVIGRDGRIVANTLRGADLVEGVRAAVGMA